MTYRSKIEWTDHTFNPWWGCTKVSPACDHCYAEAFSHRLGMKIWNAQKNRHFLSDNYWKQPLKWNAKAAAKGERARVFCASMSDVFEYKKGLTSLRDRLWSLIENTPSLIWLLLTKRPHLVNRMVPWSDDWPSNVWIGTTVEDQKWLQKRLPHMEKIPTTNRFLSCEPLLGSIDLGSWLACDIIRWVIAGGESGSCARPSDPQWFYSLRDQCQQYQIPFHFKQWGNWAPIKSVKERVPRATLNENFSTSMGKFPKKIAGRSLEGRYWNQLPKF